ncbi:MAG: diguanylate cyclase domain-containing protein, partial [Leptospirales bacterium]
GQDRTGQDRTGQDRTGQDRTGQDRTGQDRTGQDILPKIFFWNENFETGYAEIDRQHRGLVELVNRLPALSAGLPGSPSLSDVLDELRSYAAVHFGTEESLWERLPRKGALESLLVLHEEEHREFALKVGEMGRSVGPGDVPGVVLFLTHWLARHILESDRRMALVLRGVEGGLSPEEALASSDRGLDITATFTRTLLSMYDSVVEQALRLIEEIGRRRSAEASLRLMGQLFESVRDGILLIASDGTIVDANPSFCRRLLLRREALAGRFLFRDDPALFDLETLSRAWKKAGETGHFSGTILARCEGGETETLWMSLSPVKDEKGETTHLTALFAPVSSLLAERSLLAEEAGHDPLTGLANRRLFGERFDRARQDAFSGGHRGSLILVDLDRFKALNDLRGHSAGDQVLREAARRMQEAVRQSDTVARLGGDEFAVVLSGLSFGEEEASLETREAAEKLRLSLARPYEVSVLLEDGGEGAYRHSCPPSLGLALFGGDSLEESREVFDRADRALYRAKHSGGNCAVLGVEEAGRGEELFTG